MFIFPPRHVKRGREVIKQAKKLLAYKSDQWGESAVEEFQAAIAQLRDGVRSGQREPIEAAEHQLEKLAGQNTVPIDNASWRELCEVILVAIVIALGMRTYFVQPFTIPTGSMQPTLNGIQAHPTVEAPPNALVQIVQKVLMGRTWINVVAERDDVITEITEVSHLKLFNRTALQGVNRRYEVNCPKEILIRNFLGEPHAIKAGEVIARGYYDTGNHVFVDKLTYHFRTPPRNEVIVFNTQGIPTAENIRTLMEGPSQFYIKRLAGVPGDFLQIRSPELWINGKRATEPGFQRVMSLSDGYAGYANIAGRLLGSPKETYQVPERSYFVLGDNSYYSSDSRFWGPVPEKNLMGHGLFVYWPFSSHWGFIK
jgi:signal peptidase I